MVNGANAIVVRTIPGTNIRRGFAVTINSEREAEIYNNGVAAGWSSNRINNAIRAERRSASPDATFSIGNMRQVFGATGRQARIASPALNTATRNLLGQAPAGMVNPHRHHILEVNGRAGAHRGIVRDGQDILRAYDIDPLHGIENLVWAPNRGHTIGAATALVNDLRTAQQLGASRTDIVAILRRHGNTASRR